MSMRETLTTKKTILIIAVIGLVAVAALLIYGIMVTPARQPYRDALAQYENTNNALSRTSISLNSSTANNEEFQKGVDAVKAALTSLEKENAALAKATVLTDGEGKTLYVAYDEDIKEYVAYNSDVLISMQKVRPVFHKCSATMNEVVANAEGASVMRACAVDMQKATDVPDADYKQLAEAFYVSYDQLATTFEKMAAISDTNSTEYKALTEQRDEAVESFTTASNAFSKNVQQTRKEIMNTRSATDLKNYLSDHSRIF